MADGSAHFHGCTQSVAAHLAARQRSKGDGRLTIQISCSDTDIGEEEATNTACTEYAAGRFEQEMPYRACLM